MTWSKTYQKCPLIAYTLCFSAFYGHSCSCPTADTAVTEKDSRKCFENFLANHSIADATVSLTNWFLERHMILANRPFSS